MPDPSPSTLTVWLVLYLLVRNVVGELQPKRTLAASRGFLAAARLSCLYNFCTELFYDVSLLLRGICIYSALSKDFCLDVRMDVVQCAAVGGLSNSVISNNFDYNCLIQKLAAPAITGFLVKTNISYTVACLPVLHCLRGDAFDYFVFGIS